MEKRAGYCQGYAEDIDVIREREYPLLKGAFYLHPLESSLKAA